VDEPINSLEQIWPLQAQLNERAGVDTAGMGKLLKISESTGRLEADEAIRLQVGRAIKNYIDAMMAECHELQDVQNARVEAIDMLFFWISICQLLGLDSQDVYHLYEKKLQINHRRQDENRSQAQHADHEDENRQVQ
jgi:hypothetical protein